MGTKVPGFWWVFDWGLNHMEKERHRIEQEKRDVLERAKRDEAMAYQRAKDSRAALDFVIDRIMGDEEQQPDSYRGYYFNPHSLKYDIRD